MSITTPYFPCAERYAELLEVSAQMVLREHQQHAYAGFQWTERHLQCLWFDSRYRPASFSISNNEQLTVLDPGEWNLEAGPDFINSTLLVSPGERRITGDIEVHIRPSDWDHHQHSKDPAYQNVIAHITWAPTPVARTLPSSVFSLSLSDHLARRPDFSLDDIDLLAYPHAILPETPRPCAQILGTDPDTAISVLTSAAHYRLQNKACRFQVAPDAEGANQLFFEEFMAALGYKQNANAFRTLAQRVPLSILMVSSRDQALAYLLGHAGLLPQLEAGQDAESQHVIRTLWDIWWHEPHEPVDPPITWKLSGLRPQNHPIRRLSAAAALFTGIDNIINDIHALKNKTPSPLLFEELEKRIQERCLWSYWQNHLAFSSLPADGQQTVLLGSSRIASIITNVIVPYALTHNILDCAPIHMLPPEDLSAPMRTAAVSLFGRDHNPALYATNGLLQQGLLQIYHDFCLNMRTDCETCTLLQALKNESSHITNTQEG